MSNRIHFLNTGYSDCIILESNGLFAMIDAAEDTDNPTGRPSLNLPGYEDVVVKYINENCKNSDGKISEKEIKNFTEKLSKSDDVETTGSLASSKAGDFLKNQASNFIQKLIDKYKDNSESVLGIFV